VSKGVKMKKVVPKGEAFIIPAHDVKADSLGTWQIKYKVGQGERIKRYGGVRVYIPPGWSNPQIDSPLSLGYVTVQVKGHVQWRVYIHVRRWITMEVTQGSLVPGDEVIFIYGDKQYGGPGAYAGQVVEKAVEFTVSVDTEGYGNFFDVKDSPKINIIPAEIYKLDVIAPSTIFVGEQFEVLIKLTDRYDNLIGDSDRSVEIRCNAKDCEVPAECTLNKGIAKITACKIFQEGVFRVCAKIKKGDLKGTSNPILVKNLQSKDKIYWGDIHVHSSLSDGGLPPEEGYRWARDISKLDFCAITDHDDVGHNRNVKEHSLLMTHETWEKAKEIANNYNTPGKFVTLLAYEWTQTEYGVEGHRNVYYRGNDAPIFRSWDIESNRPTRLFEALEGKNAIVVPHHSLHYMSWEHDPNIQRLVEIYSMWGSSEKSGDSCSFVGTSGLEVKNSGISFQDYLARGYRVGVVASGDNHDGRPGCTVATDRWRRGKMSKKPGLVAVYAQKLTREAIFDALWKRHCYGTTGCRIILEFRINGEMMGEEIIVDSPKVSRDIFVKVIGQSTLKSVEIIKNNSLLCVYEVNKDRVEVTYIDEKEIFSTDFYYVRVTQKDGEMAWSSPIWVSLEGSEGDK